MATTFEHITDERPIHWTCFRCHKTSPTAYIDRNLTGRVTFVTCPKCRNESIKAILALRKTS